jgi:hypothetical protein
VAVVGGSIGVAFAMSVVACGPRKKPATPPPVGTATAPTTAAGPSPVPLPPGWAWPFDPAQPAVAIAELGIERPFDLSAILALKKLKGKSRCAPFEAAPNVWVKPTCKPHRLVPINFTYLDDVKRPEGAAFSTALGIQKLPPPTDPIPDAYDLRASGWDGPVKNQQLVGVCWTFALSTLMEDSMRKAGRHDLVAPLHILARKEFDAIFDGDTDAPLVGEPSWPYDPVKACKLQDDPDDDCGTAYHVKRGSWQSDAALSAEVSTANASGVYRVKNPKAIKLDQTGPLAIAGAIAHGQAVFLGIDIDSDAWDYKHVKGGRIPDWSQGGGGHAVALVAYRTVGDGTYEFLVHNSWGSTWGDKGYAWLTQRSLVTFSDEALVLDAESSVAPVPVPTPTPVPTVVPTTIPTTVPTPMPSPTTVPTPTPTPKPKPKNGCAEGQVRDLVFGNCVTPCADGSPPVATICAVVPSPSPVPSPTSTSTPIPAPKSECPTGQVKDWVTRACSKQCVSGLPPVDGLCFP